MLWDGCSSNLITLPYAFVRFDWFILHWWKWIYVQSKQRWFYLWQMEFESVCCFNNLLLRNCLSFIDHYKAASTHSHKQINCVFRWKFDESLTISKIRVDYNLQHCRSILENCLSNIYLPIKKSWGFYFQLKVSASYFLKMCLENNFLYLYVNCTIVCEYNRQKDGKTFHKYENCGYVTSPCASSECSWCLFSFHLIMFI